MYQSVFCAVPSLRSAISSDISRACLLVAGHSRIPPVGILTCWPRHAMSWFMSRLTFRCNLAFMDHLHVHDHDHDHVHVMPRHALSRPVPPRPVPSSPVRLHIKRRKIASVSATSPRLYSPRVTYQLTGLQGWHGPALRMRLHRQPCVAGCFAEYTRGAFSLALFCLPWRLSVSLKIFDGTSFHCVLPSYC